MSDNQMTFDTPKYLYRYCSANRAIQILRDKYLYLAPVDKLNDLYEASVGTLLRFTDAGVNRLAARRLETLGGLSEQEAEDLAKKTPEAEKRESFKYFVEKVQAINRRLREYSGIVCFSARFNDQRMWGTYADSHAGACIQFSSEDPQSIIHFAMPVLYTDESILDMLVDSTDIDGTLPTKSLPLLFLTKSTDWAEEAEWRIVNLGDHAGGEGWRTMGFPTSSVRRVFTGGRMTRTKRDEIHRLAEPDDWSVFELAYDSDTGESHWEGVERVRGRDDFEFWFKHRREA